MKRKKKFRKTHARTGVRNAAPAAPRAPRAPRAYAKPDSPLRRLGYTAAGAAGTAMVGSFLAREGWAPKTIATALAAVGAGLAWKGDADAIRSLGAGAMSAAGSQLALMVMDDSDKSASRTSSTKTGAALPKPANTRELPPGALENAFERAKARLALTSSTPADIDNEAST